LNQAAFAFLIGNILLLRSPVLMDLDLLVIAVPACIYGLRTKFGRIASGFVLGILLTQLELTEQLDKRLDARFSNEVVSITGEVIELPRTSEGITTFMFRVDSAELEGRRLRLSWRNPEVAIEPGQIWRLNVRLSEPTAAINFDLFDYERWLFVKRIHGRGYVRVSETSTLTNINALSMDSFRYGMKLSVLEALPGQNVATLFALALGDTGFLSPLDWEVLNATGTTHLLIVSGLHVGLIATMSFFLLRWLGLPYQLVVGSTIAITGFYALLAGWGLPVQRALIMTSVFLGAMLLQRNVTLSSQFVLALILVIGFDPLATLSNGFWMSFGAVFALMAGLSNRFYCESGFRRWLLTSARAQWVVYMSLLPVLGYVNQVLPLGSFWVNLVAIPWVGLLLVPTLLIGLLVMSVVPVLGIPIVQLSLILVDALWLFLELAQSLEPVLPISALTQWSVATAMFGVVILLCPGGLLPRWLGIVLLMALIPEPERLGPDEVRITFLDVGQGLSVLLETQSGISVYDTGPKFGARFSAADQIVVPSVRAGGWQKIDEFIISHSDNDHAGGFYDVVSSIAVKQIVSYDQCEHEWRRDGTVFRTFNVDLVNSSANDQSCLLLLEMAGDRRVLLTGDIEKAAEYALMHNQLANVTAMSIPHHGSGSSSTPALLNSLRPIIAVASAGYRNRFGHPSETVVNRYRARDIEVLVTADLGAVSLLFSGEQVIVRTARDERRALWRRTFKKPL
jgi:competence protein ComEC